MQLLRTFWDSVRHLDPSEPGEALPYATLDGLGKLGVEAGLQDVETAALEVSSRYEGFDELWGTFLLGVGPAGKYCVSLEPDAQQAVRDEYRRRLGEPEGSFALTATAWAIRGRAPG
jgi:hypothetical protein